MPCVGKIGSQIVKKALKHPLGLGMVITITMASSDLGKNREKGST